MRLAICISGIPRGKYCIDFAKTISRIHETTVFIWYWQGKTAAKHTWLGVVHAPPDLIYDYAFDPAWYDISSDSNHEVYCDHAQFPDLLPVFEKQIKECRLNYSEQNQGETLPGRTDAGIHGMTYAIMKANELRENYEKENDMKFDVVIRARFEAEFINDQTRELRHSCNQSVLDDMVRGQTVHPLDQARHQHLMVEGKVPGHDFEEMKHLNLVPDFNGKGRYAGPNWSESKEYDIENKLYTPDVNNDLKYGMCDRFAFSNSANMSYYSRIYRSINELASIEGFQPERCFHHYNCGASNHFRDPPYVWDQQSIMT